MSDWMLEHHHIYAMSVEVAPEWPYNTGNRNGFWPSHELVTPTCTRLLGANRIVAWRSGQYYTVTVAVAEQAAAAAAAAGKSQGQGKGNHPRVIHLSLVVRNVGVRNTPGSDVDADAVEGAGVFMSLATKQDGSGPSVVTTTTTAGSTSASASASTSTSTKPGVFDVFSAESLELFGLTAQSTSAPIEVEIDLGTRSIYAAVFDSELCVISEVKLDETGNVKATVVRQEAPAEMCSGYGQDQDVKGTRSSGGSASGASPLSGVFGRAEGKVSVLRDSAM
jgi:hypothetical protein